RPGARREKEQAATKTAADIEVVPGNVQWPEERRTGVVIGPARLAVGRAFVESAEMGPAVGVPRSQGLIPAQPLAAASPIQPDRQPSARRLVVQNDRIAKRVVKG